MTPASFPKVASANLVDSRTCGNEFLQRPFAHHQEEVSSSETPPPITILMGSRVEPMLAATSPR